MRRARTLHRQAGVGLMTAIFLLVGLAGLGAAIIAVTTSQAAQSALDVQGARAYQAARAGAEWAIFQQRINGACAASTTFSLPNDMSNFTVTVTCEASTPLVAITRTINRFHVTSTACSPASGACPTVTNDPSYVQRVVDVRFGD